MKISMFTIKCAHCAAKAAVRTSREISPIYREIYLQCTNIVCGHTFKASFSVVCTISPSAIPDPRVNLPIVSAKPRPANDDNLSPANDVEDPGSRGIG